MFADVLLFCDIYDEMATLQYCATKCAKCVHSKLVLYFAAWDATNVKQKSFVKKNLLVD